MPAGGLRPPPGIAPESNSLGRKRPPRLLSVLGAGLSGSQARSSSPRPGGMHPPHPLLGELSLTVACGEVVKGARRCARFQNYVHWRRAMTIVNPHCKLSACTNSLKKEGEAQALPPATPFRIRALPSCKSTISNLKRVCDPRSQATFQPRLPFAIHPPSVAGWLSRNVMAIPGQQP